MVQTTFSEKRKNRKIKFSKIENEKFFKARFLLYVRIHTRKSEKYWKMGIFPDMDAVKRQEMPNLSLFSVSGGFKLENGIVIG